MNKNNKNTSKVVSRSNFYKLMTGLMVGAIIVLAIGIFVFYQDDLVPQSSNVFLLTEDTELIVEKAVTSNDLPESELLIKYPVIQRVLDASSDQKAIALLNQFLVNFEETSYDNESKKERTVTEIAYFFAQADLVESRYRIVNLLLVEYWVSYSAVDALLFSQTQLNKKIIIPAVETVLFNHCDELDNISTCINELTYNANVEQGIINIVNKALSNNQFIKAIHWADVIEDIDLKAPLINSVTLAWVNADAEDAFQWSASREKFTDIAKAAIKKIVETDPWLAYNLVTQISETNSQKRSELYVVIVDTLIAKGDFLTMVSILESASQHETISEVAQKWIDADPKSALEWALNYEDFSTLGLRAIDELTKSDYQEAFEITSLVPDDKRNLRMDMYNSIFSDRAQKDDYTTIMSLLSQLPRSEKAENYYENFIDEWAWQDPQSAIGAVLELPHSAKKTEFVMETLQTWSEKEPFSAIKNVNNLKGEGVKVSATVGVIQGWATKDMNEMIDWVFEQPNSETLDVSIAQASNRLVRKQQDKMPLIRLAGKIKDDKLRESTLAKIQAHVFSELDSESD